MIKRLETGPRMSQAVVHGNTVYLAGQADAMNQVAAALRTEWGALWLMLGLGLVNIVLAVWRPRLSRRRATS